MLSIVKSYGLSGIIGYEVDVEVDIGKGLPGIEFVGLPDAAIKESKERVRSAIKNSGFRLSPEKITINLSPASTKKEGSFFDLSVAIGILSASEQLMFPLPDCVFIGELSLDGSINRVSGILPILISAKENGRKTFVIPKANASEAKFISGIKVYALENLKEAANFVTQPNSFSSLETKDDFLNELNANYSEDFKFVKGQFAAKRALEIAAAGGHNVLLIGPPGGGKTMMAKCLPSIMPSLTSEEALETTKIHSVVGAVPLDSGIINKRPFITPHHTISRIALTGGGSNANPGLISMAHNGILFLDEMLEYPRSVLEILRQPLEDNVITISRAIKTVQYPADFMLVASMNPCPCGNYGSQTAQCTCTPAQVHKYLGRLSGPLMDRIDLQINVDNVTYDDLSSNNLSESSDLIRFRVQRAREIQLKRFNGTGVFANAKMTSQMVKDYCALTVEGEELLKQAFLKLKLSARAYNRILKVARTIADLAGEENILPSAISEAVMYRSLDKEKNGL